MPSHPSARELEQLTEVLANIEHERWAHWQRYVHDHCDRAPDGSLVIPAELVARWEQQIACPFSKLSESEKESDRDQVRRYLPIILQAFGIAAGEKKSE
ncbi:MULTISPECIES: hypothetical protein [Bradyrhizobium]|uniref:hypothetical protein n=1 Tax=Bradyrhizobium TaxID=374 RepID=UPI00042004BF|nr:MULTISPECIES: hypothetical protein [Bradyrhizobium]UFW51112.1 hypothetical protein BaraCB756_08805 [Bradyrhizobium arachidis]